MPNRNGYVKVRHSEDDALGNVSMPKNEACNHAMTIKEYKEKFAFTNIQEKAKEEKNRIFSKFKGNQPAASNKFIT